MKNLLLVVTTACLLSAIALFADSMSIWPLSGAVSATQPAATEPATQPAVAVESDDQSVASLRQTISSLQTELEGLKEENARLQGGTVVPQNNTATTQPASSLEGDTESTKLRKTVALLQSEIRRLKSDNTALRTGNPGVSSPSSASSASSSSSGSSHSSSASGNDGPVHVKGYYRKDGTYVRPHTRRR